MQLRSKRELNLPFGSLGTKQQKENNRKKKENERMLVSLP